MEWYSSELCELFSLFDVNLRKKVFKLMFNLSNCDLCNEKKRDKIFAASTPLRVYTSISYCY